MLWTPTLQKTSLDLKKRFKQAPYDKNVHPLVRIRCLFTSSWTFLYKVRVFKTCPIFCERIQKDKNQEHTVSLLTRHPFVKHTRAKTGTTVTHWNELMYISVPFLICNCKLFDVNTTDAAMSLQSPEEVTGNVTVKHFVAKDKPYISHILHHNSLMGKQSVEIIMMKDLEATKHLQLLCKH